MWLSPSDDSGDGKRYSLQEIAALSYSLGLLLDMVRNLSPRTALDEPILQRMEPEELVFALYEVFQALLEDKEVPDTGHPGYQEAIIFELLEQTHACIVTEIQGGEEEDDHARRAAWHSFKAFAPETDEDGRPFLDGWLEDHEVSPTDPFPQRSAKLTAQAWHDVIDSISQEFLRDTDWQLEKMMDLPEEKTARLREMMGIDLRRAHRLPHSPTSAELNMATSYLQYLIWKDEVFSP